MTDALVARAGDLAWEHDLRGFDAAQLAAALAWRETTENRQDEIVFASFDNELVQAAAAEGSRHGRDEDQTSVRPQKPIRRIMKAPNGGLFANDFLKGSIVELDEWQALTMPRWTLSSSRCERSSTRFRPSRAKRKPD